MTTLYEEVETLLGVRAEDVGNPLALADCVEAGLPVSALDRIAEALAPGDAAFKNKIVPKSTLERRRKNNASLTTDEGDRVARLGKVFEMATWLYQDPGKAREFLRRPHMMLENKAPMDVALATGIGADAVMNLLGRAAFAGGV